MSEYETEWEPTLPLAPEFQGLTPSVFVGYVNKHTKCDGQAFDARLNARRSFKTRCQIVFWVGERLIIGVHLARYTNTVI